MQRFRVVGVGVKELDIAEQVKGVFGIVILLGKEGVNKLKKLKKLGMCSGALKGLGKVSSKIPFIQEGLYLENNIIDIFKDKI